MQFNIFKLLINTKNCSKTALVLTGRSIVLYQWNIPPFFTFFDATLITSVAIVFGEYLSREVATTGNWYSRK